MSLGDDNRGLVVTRKINNNLFLSINFNYKFLSMQESVKLFEERTDSGFLQSNTAAFPFSFPILCEETFCDAM